jgi:hypothetical protein
MALTAKLGDLSFWFFSSAARLRLRLPVADGNSTAHAQVEGIDE